MQISRIYNLGKSQAELDFVDIDIIRDMPLFLDPFFLGNRQDKWSSEATFTLRSFFQKLIDLTKAGNERAARQLFGHVCW
jgi:hypothetical protein